MRRAMNRTVGDKTHESARYGSYLTVERPSRKGFDRLGLILIRQALEGRLPLFTESPRRLILGNRAPDIGTSLENLVSASVREGVRLRGGAPAFLLPRFSWIILGSGVHREAKHSGGSRYRVGALSCHQRLPFVPLSAVSAGRTGR